MKVPHLTGLLACIAISMSCNTANLKDGDLLFVPSAGTDFDNAIAASTATNGLDFTHVAYYYNGKVIEAVPAGGVICRPLSEFIKDNPTFIVRRLDAIDSKASANNMLSHLGEPYDFLYTQDNGRMYCSELMQSCVVDTEGNLLLPTICMNFLDSDGNMPEFWEKVFASENADIPQGEPGTNPTQLFIYIESLL